jgi:hypothetical protein
VSDEPEDTVFDELPAHDRTGHRGQLPTERKDATDHEAEADDDERKPEDHADHASRTGPLRSEESRAEDEDEEDELEDDPALTTAPELWQSHGRDS